MAKIHVAVGIYNKEIFIAEIDTENPSKIHFGDVLRYVTEQRLDDYRDPSELREYCKEAWKAAVASDSYEDSLDAYTDEIIADTDMDDEENYPFKDESGLEYLTLEDREEADAFIKESEGDDVGTWECSGCYPPNTARYHKDGWYSDFKKFDYVFNNEEAQKIAKQYCKK